MPRLGGDGLASHLIGRAVLLAAAETLRTSAIPVMPLKGIWLQHAVYDDPGARLITDVDVLVPEHQHSLALEVLLAAGWELLGSSRTEAAVRAPDWPLPLDLHRRLFPRGAFRMSTPQLFARGTPELAVYGAAVVAPDPRDVFAHLVGHFVKRRGAWVRDAAELRDLPRLAARFALAPDSTARHLVTCGLARAGLYTLQCIPEHDDPTGFCARTRAILRADRIGARYAAAMLHLRDRVDVASPLAALPGFVLEQSLPQALRSAMFRGWDRWRESDL